MCPNCCSIAKKSVLASALDRLHFDGVAEDDLSFSDRHILVAGADLCTVTGGAYQECHHLLPPDGHVE